MTGDQVTDLIAAVPSILLDGLDIDARLAIARAGNADWRYTALSDGEKFALIAGLALHDITSGVWRVDAPTQARLAAALHATGDLVAPAEVSL